MFFRQFYKVEHYEFMFPSLEDTALRIGSIFQGKNLLLEVTFLRREAKNGKLAEWLHLKAYIYSPKWCLLEMC